MAGIADIAKAAGVSNAVVSRVINRDATLRISKETRMRVLKVIEEQDYAPNSAASSLRSTRSGLIAMVVNDVTNPVYSEILSGAQHKATSLGQAIIISETSALEDRASRLLRLIGGGGVDGLILQGDCGVPDMALARAARMNIPTVLLQNRHDAEAALLTVPDREATSLATQHLLELGHTKIACLATRKGPGFGQDRIDGWTSTLSDAGLKLDGSLLEFADTELGDARAMTRKLMQKNPGLTGLVCCDTMFAVGALEAAHELGISVPENLSIVSIHDFEMARHLRVPMTTVKMPLFEVGAHAIEILGKAASEPVDEYTIPEPPILIRRSSTQAI